MKKWLALSLILLFSMTANAQIWFDVASKDNLLNYCGKHAAFKTC